MSAKTLKAPLSLFLCLALVLSMLAITPLHAHADSMTSGDWEYELQEDSRSVCITKYLGHESKVTIPSSFDGKSITQIGNSTFEDNTYVNEVIIPDTVTEIGSWVFKNCSGLTTVTIPDSVTRIGDYAFENCALMTGLDLPESLTSIGNSFIMKCPEIREITIPKSVTQMPAPLEGSFVEKVNLTDGWTKIPNSAFENAEYLKEITIPDTVTVIGAWAFKNCTSLPSISIPENVTEIGEYAFENCALFKELDIPEGVTSIGNSFIMKCPEIREITIPKSVTQMPASLEGSSVEKVSLTDGWPKIPKSAFENAENLKEISIPDSVTEIVSWAFKNCTSLEDLTIPETVTSLGDYVFENCDSLTEFTIPESVTEIGNGAFLYCDSLKTLLWNHQLTYVPGSAAAYCRSLTTFKYPEAKQEEPGAYAFPDILESIDSEAFRECDSLTKVTLPDSVTEIGDSAFENCDSLTEVTLPDTVCRLKQYAFYDCDSLTSVRLSQGLTEIRNNLFEHCDALTSIIIPCRVKEIGYRAFRNCTSLTSVTLPRSLEHVDDEVFSYPKKMTIYGVPDSYAQSYAEEIGSKFEPLEVPAQSASFQVDELQLYNWSSFRLVLSVTPDHFTDEVIWKSSDPDIVSVEEDGTITARNTGDVKITASAGNCSAVCKVRVIQPVTSLWLDRDDLSIELNETLQLVANIHPDNAYNREVRWESSDESTVSVNENGLITALKTGSAIITVTSVDNETIKDTCKVTVTNFAHRCSTVEEMESPHPYPNNSKDYWIYSIPEANSLLVTFDAKTEVEEKYDYIEIYDSTNRLLDRYTGTELAGKTIRIPGELVKILLNSDAAGTGWGFQVTAIQGLDKCYDGHDWDVGTITKAATVSATGIKTYTCTVCGATKTETLPKLKTNTLTIKTASKSYAYSTKAQNFSIGISKAQGAVTYTLDKAAKTAKITVKNGKVTIPKSCAVGTYKITVKAAGNVAYAAGSKVVTIKITQAVNPLTIKVSSKSYYSSKLKKAAAFTIGATKGQGKVTYTPNTAAKKAKIKVTAAGKVTVPKKCRKGTYKITVKAAGNKNYKAGTKTVTIKVK